jgi:beta-lactamase superfamily II metal-dependent hydrolase
MAESSIRIRSYNVGFGDCFLVSFREAARTWQMLIDFGNAPTNSSAVFEGIAADIYAETAGHIDVVVMTHEHLDHMSGFYSQRKVFNKITVGQVWMSLPSEPDYYKNYPKAQPLKKLREAAAGFAAHCEGRRLTLAPGFYTMLLNNLSNIDRISYVRNLAGNPKKVLYLRRGNSVRGKPFPKSFNFSMLAPEKDVSVYYGKGSKSLAMQRRGLLYAGADVDAGDRKWLFKNVPRCKGAVPPNLSAADWRRLRDSIQTGAVDSVRAIDRAQNNTSLVFLVEFAGRRLLFPGDAELESWDVMQRKCGNQLRDIDFLKVAHHGSHNGTPSELLDQLLPVERKQQVTIMVSTMSKVYGTKHPVPDKETIKDLKRRCRRLISTDGDDRLYIDVEI